MSSAASKNQQNHRNRLMRYIPSGSTVYMSVMLGRDGNPNAAKFYAAPAANEIADITGSFAEVTESKWDDRSGLMLTKSPSDAVSLVALRLYDNPNALKCANL